MFNFIFHWFQEHSRVRSIIKFCSNLEAHYNSLQHRGTAVLSKKMPLLTELLQGQVRIILTCNNIYSAPKNNMQTINATMAEISHLNNPSRFLPHYTFPRSISNASLLEILTTVPQQDL